MSLHVTLIKPSAYEVDGYVKRYRRSYLPNATLSYIQSMTPSHISDGNGRNVEIRVNVVDEIVARDLRYLDFRPQSGVRRLVALVGTYSHQIHRAADIAALAASQGAMAVIGGPHVMACDTKMLQGRGISFSLAEADLVWEQILFDAAFEGRLRAAYGEHKRLQDDLRSPVLIPPPRKILARQVLPMMAIYPSRGCPFSCNFCTIYKFAGHSVRSQSIETTLDSIRNARAAGVKIVVFTCDNTNKMGELPELCDAMVAENLATPFMCQCDAQIVRQEWLLAKMSRAGCRVIMIGVESFSREALKKAGKGHNQPDQYAEIARMCKRHGIVTVFSNIIGMPEDTEASVREHVRLLKLASPAAAYFFILTPIPGSDQYADFRSQGLITERNLDRFDATHPCWTHPNLSHDQLKRLMWESIESYHGLGNNLWRTIGSLKLGVSPTFAALGFGYAGLMKYKARRREHQIVGGLGRFRLDAARNYSLLRRKTYGFDHFPLPDNLSLPETDLAADQMRLRDKDHLLRISPAGETVRA